MTTKQDPKLQCPCCCTELVVTHRDRYQNLGEHVSNPNGEPSLKEGYQCPNEWCVCHKSNLNCTWIDDGEIYISPPGEFKRTIAHQVIKKMSSTGRYYALNSWNDDYEELKELEVINTRRFRIGNFVIKSTTEFYRSKFGRPAPRFFPRIEYIYNGVYVIPFWRMTTFQIKRFAKNYSSALKGEEHALKECYKIANGISHFGKNKDDRFFSKLTSILLRTFFPLGCKKINQLYGRKEEDPLR